MAVHTCVLFVAIFCLTAAQVPIPKRKLGYVFGEVKGLTAVNVDAFMGPLCPDSKQTFPTLLQLASHYGPGVLTLRMHMFPLPYHRNSFLVAMVRHWFCMYCNYMYKYNVPTCIPLIVNLCILPIVTWIITLSLFTDINFGFPNLVYWCSRDL